MADTTVTQQLTDVKANFEKNAPEPIKSIIQSSHAELISSADMTGAIKVGDTLPSFELPNAVGERIRSEDVLAAGPMLLTFYRGGWCPYCNIALNGLQKHVEAFRAKGVTLVAISPELPDTSLTTVEKHAIGFQVLSDIHNDYARQLGIALTMPSQLKTAFEKMGNDLTKRNGDESFQVPHPVTLLVDTHGTVKNAYIEADYSKRLDPTVALKWVDSLAANGAA